MAKIASILNEATISSPQGKSWRSSTVENILKNPVYTGMLVWNIHKYKRQTFEFSDYHKPLINQFLIQLSENNIKLQHEFGRLDTPFIFLNKLSCTQCHQTLITQNGSTTRKGKKYYYQYYVCKHCHYKLDLDEVHGNLLPRIFKYVQDLACSETSKQSAIEYLDQVSNFLDESISNLKKRIDKLISKGSIANEQNDREYQHYVEAVQSRLITSLESLLNSRDILEELYEAVQTNLFFDRFKQILDSQLGDQRNDLSFFTL